MGGEVPCDAAVAVSASASGVETLTLGNEGTACGTPAEDSRAVRVFRRGSRTGRQGFPLRPQKKFGFPIDI